MHRLCWFCWLVMLTACAANPTGPARPARINHVVFFTLHDPADTEELIRDCDTKLATIPGVVSYFAGPHFEMGRDSVDAEYDVGLYVGFMSAADYRFYVDHPDHIAVVTKWRPRLQSLLVRDVLDEGV